MSLSNIYLFVAIIAARDSDWFNGAWVWMFRLGLTDREKEKGREEER